MNLPSKRVWATRETPLGWIGLLAGPEGMIRTLLPRPRESAVRAILEEDAAPRRSQRTLSPWLSQLNQALGGRSVDFSGWTLDWRKATPFQRRVWETTRRIPWGQTRSYWWVAVRAGDPRAARAVGRAMGANPLPIVIPCHRVVRSDGTLGGFGGGAALKRRLLEAEGVAAPMTGNAGHRR